MKNKKDIQADIREIPEITPEEVGMIEIIDKSESAQIIKESGEFLETKSGALMAAVTEMSTKHKQNEDRALISKNDYAAVFDGLGGYGNGAEASQTAAEIISQEFEKIKGSGLTDLDVERIKTVMSETIKRASREILQKITDNPEMKNMGTTATIVKICEMIGGAKKALIANVGDSRAYLLRNGKLTRLTEDDSFVNYLLKRKYGSAEYSPTLDEDPEVIDALAKSYNKKSKDLRSAATLALGSSESFHEELEDKLAGEIIREVDLEKGDVILLVSDGVIDNIPDNKKESALNAGGNEVEMAERIVRTAGIAELDPNNKMATPDDKTAVVIKI